MAPEFAGIDLGLAEKMALRAVATATGVEPERGCRRGAGDRRSWPGRRAVIGCHGRRWKPSLQVAAVVDTLHRSPAPRMVSKAASSSCSPASTRATPLEARYLLRLVTGKRRESAHRRFSTRWHRCTRAAADRPVLERAYNTLLRSGPRGGDAGDGRTDCSQGAAGAGWQPSASDAGPAVVRGQRDSCQVGWAVWPSTSTTACGTGASHGRRPDRAVHRRQQQVSTQFPTWLSCCRPA